MAPNPAANDGAPADPLARLADVEIASVEQEVGVRDCMLYALSVGFGTKPADPGHLKFVYEQDTQIVPSMVLSFASPGFWFKDPRLGLHWEKLLNVGQSVEIARLPSPPARVRSASWVLEVLDKGPNTGSIVSWERRLWDEDGADPFATVTSTFLLRGDGREKRTVKAGTVRHVYQPLPARAPDRVLDIATSTNSGLLYRLNGTLNPLHADPDVAAAAGFPRPLMPGTASLGWVCAALVEHVCAFDPTRIAGLGARLTAPIYPGDHLRCELWLDGEHVGFRAGVPERDAIVLDHGRARLGNLSGGVR
jgi:acyl dehydratase